MKMNFIFPVYGVLLSAIALNVSFFCSSACAKHILEETEKDASLKRRVVDFEVQRIGILGKGSQLRPEPLIKPGRRIPDPNVV